MALTKTIGVRIDENLSTALDAEVKAQRLRGRLTTSADIVREALLNRFFPTPDLPPAKAGHVKSAS